MASGRRRVGVSFRRGRLLVEDLEDSERRDRCAAREILELVCHHPSQALDREHISPERVRSVTRV